MPSGDDVICPLPPPCECDRDDPIVYCRDKNLTAVPTVTKADGLWTFYLGANQIRHVASRNFVGVTLQMLILDSNKIDSIADDAFAGSEDSLIVLDYRNYPLLLVIYVNSWG